jgi:threonine/homoserine/homoserine lactone efflux protein
MIAKAAVSASRADGLAAALGMGIGAVVFAIAALFGLQGLLLAVPSLYIALKIAGGLYLAYLGVRIWAAARHPLPVVEGEAGARVSVFRSFALGFATQVSNPKTAIVYASVFAAFLPSAPTLQFNLVLLVLIFVVEAGWYAIVALILSAEHPREIYRRYKAWLDRLAGGVMIALGARLIASARNAA